MIIPDKCVLLSISFNYILGRVQLIFLYFTLLLPVATPHVNVTRDPTGTLYVGGNVTLKCLIRLDSTVDTNVTVAVVWSASDGVAIDNTSCYTVSPVTGSFPTYNATLPLSDLMMSDSSSYTCNATVSADPPSSFIVPSEVQSELLSVTIGKIIHFNSLYIKIVAFEF